MTVNLDLLRSEASLPLKMRGTGTPTFQNLPPFSENETFCPLQYFDAWNRSVGHPTIPLHIHGSLSLTSNHLGLVTLSHLGFQIDRVPLSPVLRSYFGYELLIDQYRLEPDFLNEQIYLPVGF